MVEAFIQFGLMAVVIVIAGVFLTRSADAISDKTQMGKLLAGSILLAGATSLPELMIDISAIRKGMPDLAVGDLFGSSLMNLLILAIVDFLHRSPHKMFSREGAEHALSASLSITVTALAALAIFLSSRFGNLGIWEFGIGPIAIVLFYVLGLRVVSRDQKITSADEPEVKKNHKGLVRDISIYIAAGLAIVIAAPYLAEAAGTIAEETGLGKTFVGTTLVALCTSLPELVSTISAVRMGAFDMAVGNIFGSNAFNMILLLPLDGFHRGNLLATVSNSHVLTALAVILASSVAVMGQLYQEEHRKKLIEPDAVSVIVLVLGSLYLLYWTGAT
ncbi:sodium:calcium antiporter [Oligoflexus tunisiensis]|uniref:sodium:calcium antiporter n=1 Tax=Oligoflexus tunisiensis TaxID=708132 RepID=UPI00159F0A8D|nr:sodium:calcium antiporter [Oligoflexus tunisiensis]